MTPSLSPNAYLFSPLTICLTFVAYSILYLNRKPLSLVKSKLQEEFHLSSIALGWLDTSFSICHSLGLFLLPLLIKRFYYGKHNTLLFIVYSLISLFVFLFANSKTNLSLLFLWGVHGFLDAPIYPILITLITQGISKKSRSYVFCIWGTSHQFSSLLSTFLSDAIISSFHWRFLFIFPSILTFFTGLVLYIFLPNWFYDTDFKKFTVIRETKLKDIHQIFDTELESKDTPSIGIPTSKNINKLQRYAKIYEPANDKYINSKNPTILEQADIPEIKQHKIQSKRLLRIMILPEIILVSSAYFCIKLMRYSMINWLPFIVTKVFKFSPIAAGYFATFFDIGSIIGSILIGFLADRFMKGSRSLMVSFSILALSISFFFTAHTFNGDYWYFCIGLISIGFFLAGPDIMLSSVIPQDIFDNLAIDSESSVVIIGIVNGIGTVGTIFHGYLVASISSIFGWSFLFLIFGALSILAMIFMFLVHFYQNRN